MEQQNNQNSPFLKDNPSNLYASPQAQITPNTVMADESLTTKANFGWRLLAWLIDVIATSIIGLIIGAVIGVLFVLTSTESLATDIISNIIGIIIGWLYFALFESSKLQATLGKLAVGCKVTNSVGGRASFGQVTGRHFAKIISTLMLGIGYLWMLWDDESQTIHDKISGCYVWKK